MNRRTTFAALLGTAALVAGGATAQTGSYLDQLVSGSASFVPMRSIDTSTRAAKRYAVVIGNSGYAAIPDLPNAQADAEVVAEFLKSQDYIVHQHLDITKRGFEDVLRRILFDVDKDTEVVIFFAGHGFQIGSENYLVPVDADLDTVYDIPFEAVSLGSLLSIVGARARLQVVILDSCRDNPFAGRAALADLGSNLRETKTGFSSVAAPINSMLVYSTAPGALAYDGEGENSPFTAALVTEASARPDDEIKDVFEDVRRTVYAETRGRQVPWDSSTLIERASFGIGASLGRPLSVSSFGTGQSRGLARIAGAGPEQLTLASDVVASAAIEAEFEPEIAIGPALLNALDLAPTDRVTISRSPETGRLVLPQDDGRREEAEGRELAPAEIDRLLLVNTSVQTPALSLEGGTIADSLEVSVGGQERTISLALRPGACDFLAGDHLDPDGMGVTRYPNEIEPASALAACEAAIADAPEVSRFHYQKGRALLALRDLDGAEAAFEAARDLGHARAWYALGTVALERARQGDRVIDGAAPEDVLALYARGVDEGDPYAFYALGRQLMRFGGTDAIEVEGYDLVMRSLEVGHTFAMNDLASFYLDTDSEYFDGERGLRYLRESASRGDIYGYNSLGIAHWRGRAGLEVDTGEAFRLFTLAASEGHPTAPYNIARMYRDGEAPGGRDLTRAVEWFDTGLGRGDARAAVAAALLIGRERPAGYDVFDAAVFAARGATLRGNSATREAEELLSRLAVRDLDGGAQRLVNELGGSLTVDGAFGASSMAAFEAVLAAHGEGPAATDPRERILQLARIAWRTSPYRVDLF